MENTQNLIGKVVRNCDNMQNSELNDFDIDEEININMQDKSYKNNFTISQSLKDFTDFHNHLKEVASKL